MKNPRIVQFAVILLVLAATIGSIGGLLAWRNDRQELEARRKEFLARYAAAMEDAIRSQYFMLEKLPQSAQELIYPGTEIRSPWVMDGIVECRFNRPSLEAGWLKLESEVFAEVNSRCPARIPDWRRDLDLARQPLLDREGRLDEQLDLFCDRAFDGRAGYKFLEELRTERGVAEETISDFAEAARDITRIEGHREFLRQYNDPQRVELLSETELAKARQEFERLKRAILQQAAGETPVTR